jgi:hypothetical protein
MTSEWSSLISVPAEWGRGSERHHEGRSRGGSDGSSSESVFSYFLGVFVKVQKEEQLMFSLQFFHCRWTTLAGTNLIFFVTTQIQSDNWTKLPTTTAPATATATVPAWHPLKLNGHAPSCRTHSRGHLACI